MLKRVNLPIKLVLLLVPLFGVYISTLVPYVSFKKSAIFGNYRKAVPKVLTWIQTTQSRFKAEHGTYASKMAMLLELTADDAWTRERWKITRDTERYKYTIKSADSSTFDARASWMRSAETKFFFATAADQEIWKIGPNGPPVAEIKFPRPTEANYFLLLTCLFFAFYVVLLHSIASDVSRRIKSRRVRFLAYSVTAFGFLLFLPISCVFLQASL